MKPMLIQYPRCGTCKKAVKWLNDNGIEFDDRDIIADNPKANELSVWMKRSQKPASKFFNTSGLRYRALNLKDVVKTAPDEELLKLLSSEGMLVKRPLLITETNVLVGFNDEEWGRELKVKS